MSAPDCDAEICGDDEVALHGCPYEELVNNDYETDCRCCSACEAECYKRATQELPPGDGK